jgi:hypothetical protein
MDDVQMERAFGFYVYSRVFFDLTATVAMMAAYLRSSSPERERGD